MKKKSVLIIALLVLLIPFLFSLRNQQVSTPQKKYKDSFVIATDAVIGEIKPYSRIGISNILSYYVYSPLFFYGKDEGLHPVLASSYNWEDEGKKLRVKLQNVSAKDVQKTIEYYKTIDLFDIKHFLQNFKYVELVSNTEVIFHLTRYDRLFLEYLSVVPMIAFSREDWTTGKFRVLEISEKHIVLQRKVPSSHLINYIKVYQISPLRDTYEKLLKGEVDFAFYNYRVEEKYFKEHPKLTFFPGDEKTLAILLGGQGALDWQLVNKQIDNNYLEQLFGACFDQRAESSLYPESKWYLEGFNSGFSIKEAEKFSGQENKNYNIYFFPGMGRVHTLAQYIKKLMSEHSSAEVNVELMNDDKEILKIGERGSFWNGGKRAKDLFLTFLDGKRSFLNQYIYFKSEKNDRQILNYRSDAVNHYLDQARYTQDFTTARYALNKAVEEVKQDPPGLFLFWSENPLLMRKACRLSTELGPRYFFQALDDIECIEE